MGYCEYYIIDIATRKETLQYIWEASAHADIISDVDYLVKRLIRDQYFKRCSVKIRRCTCDMANYTKGLLNAYILGHIKTQEVVYETVY